MPKGQFTPYTKEQEEMILNNYLTIPLNKLARDTNSSPHRVKRFLASHNLVIPRKVILARKFKNQFKKGHRPKNKGMRQEDYMSPEAIEKTKATRFKKNRKSDNELPVGSITIRSDCKAKSDRKYKFIKVSEEKWEMLHKHLWEQKNGKVPSGYCLWFKDGNSLNADLKNIELITRAENLNRNFLQYPNEVKRAIKLKNRIIKNLK